MTQHRPQGKHQRLQVLLGLLQEVVDRRLVGFRRGVGQEVVELLVGFEVSEQLERVAQAFTVELVGLAEDGDLLPEDAADDVDVALVAARGVGGRDVGVGEAGLGQLAHVVLRESHKLEGEKRKRFSMRAI